MFFLDAILVAILACAVTFMVGVLIISTQYWHGRWTQDDYDGIQKFHDHPASRIGGAALVLGIFVPLLILDNELSALLVPLLSAGLIPFFIGFQEDITRRVSVGKRLLATMAGAGLAIFLTGQYLNRLDIPGVDVLMDWWPVGACVTVIAVGGVTNAVNILDGFNGLASGTVVVILAFLGLIAFHVNDILLLRLCLLVSAAVLGFMLLNYPFGKIFLGDAGAYFLGFLMAWIALLLPMRNSDVSPWASLLVCAYPVVEVLYSMVRRMVAKKQTGQPDNLHLHTLIKTRIVRRYFKGIPVWAKNALVAPAIWLCSAGLGWIANSFVNQVLLLVALFMGFVLWYHLTYRFLLTLPELNHDGVKVHEF